MRAAKLVPGCGVSETLLAESLPWDENLRRPKPARKRGRLPSVADLGGACECCGDTAHVERMHLLRGAYKEDDLDLVMLGCGDFGACRVHPRHTREDTATAAAEIRAVMRPESARKIVARRGRDWFEREYPSQRKAA